MKDIIMGYSREELFLIRDKMYPVLPDCMLPQLKHHDLYTIPPLPTETDAEYSIPLVFRPPPSNTGSRLSARGVNPHNLTHVPLLQEIPVNLSSERFEKTESTTGVCYDNLIAIPLEKKCHKTNLLKFSWMNIQSLRNKTLSITDYAIENHIDIMAFTETWLSPGNKDDSTIATLCPKGYNFMHLPRSTGTGGGVGLLYKSNLDLSKVSHDHKSTFEHLQVKFRYQSDNVHLVVLYRPPPNRRNGFTFDIFNSEFCDLVDSLIIDNSKLLFAGDFNVHMDTTDDKEAAVFSSTLDSYGLQQHVLSATHRRGHILDLVITRVDDNIVETVHVDDGMFLSDHFCINSTLKIRKPALPKKEIKTRKLHKIDTDIFSQEIDESPLGKPEDFDSLAELVASYNSILAELLDRYAPQKSRTVTLHPDSPWYNAEIADAKRKRRKAEKRWRRSKLEIHREMYIDARNTVKNMIAKAKASYYSDKIEKAADSKELFKVVDSLLCQKNTSPLPSSDSDAELANNFSNFFAEKIAKIRDHLSSDQSTLPEEAVPNAEADLSEFTPITEEEVKKVILSTKSSSCDQDPIPTPLLKSCIDSILPAVTKIVNLSLESSTMPSDFKKATVLPLIKKTCLDKEIFKNYRPISNLAYIAKVIERTVASRLKDHMDINFLNEVLQSAYKTIHSTESALLKVQDDVLQALDKKKGVVLVLLDLSAAFDTVDHNVLLGRLHKRLGLKGRALKWFQSYLKGRFQNISINGTKSGLWELLFGVPQGSVLGPILFTIYTLPLGDIFRKHNISFHLYADDTQIYVTCDAENINDEISKIEACIAEVRMWMAANFLCLNDSKTEVLLLGSKSFLKDTETISLKIGDHTVNSTTHARNIGAIMDNTMNMQLQINQTCKSAWFALRKIAMIRQYLSQKTAEKLVHAFVSAKLDFMNGLLYKSPSVHVSKLQRVQNAAARLITGTKMREHISPVLKSLHWLPVKQRIHYKILLFVYKALNGLAPQYIRDLIQPVQHVRTLRSSSKCLLNVPRSNSVTYGDRGFSMAGPVLWNSLPEPLQKSESIDIFKKKLKTHLFGEAFNV
jgi:exonuclease III